MSGGITEFCGWGDKERRIHSTRKRKHSGLTRGRQKERMHQCQRVKWSRLMSEQKMKKGRSWSSCYKKEPGSCYKRQSRLRLSTISNSTRIDGMRMDGGCQKMRAPCILGQIGKDVCTAAAMFSKMFSSSFMSRCVPVHSRRRGGRWRSEKLMPQIGPQEGWSTNVVSWGYETCERPLKTT